MITVDGSKKVDDGQKLADERLLKKMHLSSSESEVDDKKIPEMKGNQLKRGMSSDSEEDNQTKKAKNEGQYQQQEEEVEMASLSEEDGSNQDEGSDAEQGEARSKENKKDDEDGDEDGDKESLLYIKGRTSTLLK